MRAFVKLTVAAAIVVICATHLHAAPAGIAAGQSGPSLTQLVQDGYYYDDGFWPACPEGQHYACWYEPYGHRYCGCWPGGLRPACPSGYHYACHPQPNGYRSCGCY